jgi:hypothetical protein
MLPDLPLVAVKRVIDLARGRIIFGTNRYAVVCRQWRHAGCSSDEAEQLRLYLDVCNMSAAEFASACSWMSLHGTQVDVLIIEGPAADLDAFVRVPPAALRNLTRLEVLQQGSLALLAPMLEQLPHLRHLAASVWLGCDDATHLRHLAAGVWLGCDDATDESEADESEAGEGEGPGPKDAAGMFCDRRWTRWEALPDMGHLCAQLTHLHLTLDTEEPDLMVDPRLPELLPAHLQQLTLAVAVPAGCYVPTLLQPSSLEHLSGLRKLTLGPGLGDGDGYRAKEVMRSLPALQQLCMDVGDHDRDDALQLAPVLTDYTVEGLYEGDVEALGHLTRLTSLRAVMYHPLGEEERLLEGLTGLQQLELDTCCDEDALGLLDQAAGISSLRTVAIRHTATDLAAVMARLALCTQLTFLRDLGLEQEEDAADDPPQVPVPPVPTELTGLRCLVMGMEAFLKQDTPWLAALTNLTFLCVVHNGDPDEEEEEGEAPGVSSELESELREVAALVHAWPSSLRRVVFWMPPNSELLWDEEDAGCRTHWELTPAPVLGVCMSVWKGSQEPWVKGWACPGQPCPHLPGVWELLEAPSSS